MPSEIRTVLASSGESNIDKLAEQADRMVEVSELSTSFQSISAARPAPNKNFYSKAHVSDKLCFYHNKFGKKARKCNKDDCPMKGTISSIQPSDKVDSENSSTSRQ